jgi:hypothetical protein
MCPINYNNHQISRILKIFYGDIGVYFYVCIKILFMICYIYHKYIFVCVLFKHMYAYCSYNESRNWYLNSEIYYSNMKIDISVLKIIFESNILKFKY